MKKLLAIVLTAVLLISAGTMGVVALCANFADENENGVCDNRETGRNFVDSDNSGVCDNRETGRDFVDEDNDGVCDNREEGSAKGRDCRGKGGCNSQGRGVCKRGS